jgi:hypothetical protein
MWNPSQLMEVACTTWDVKLINISGEKEEVFERQN